jgi:PAS domain S-box-containing protein
LEGLTEQIVDDRSPLSVGDALCRALDDAPCGFVVVGFDGVVLGANRVIANWVRPGASAESLRGVALAADTEIYAAVRRAAGGEASQLETAHPPLVARAGCTFRLGVMPVRSRGRVVAVGLMFEDRTLQSLAAEAFEAAERRFRLLIDSMHEGVAVHRNGILLYVNPAGINMLGYRAADELVGRRLLELIHPDGRQAALRGLTELRPVGNVASEDAVFLKRDGMPLDVEVKASSAPLGDGFASFLFFRDVSELRRLRSSSSAPIAKAAQAEHDAGSPLIVVCDDESRLASLTAGLLAEYGYRSLATGTLDEALAAINAAGEQVGALVLDVSLPGQDPRNVVARLRAAGYAGPVLLTSGYAEEDVPRELLADPQVVAYLPKPSPIERLVAEISAALLAGGHSAPARSSAG